MTAKGACIFGIWFGVINSFVGFCMMMDHPRDNFECIFVICGTVMILTSIITLAVISPKVEADRTVEKVATSLNDTLNKAAKEVKDEYIDEQEN